MFLNQEPKLLLPALLKRKTTNAFCLILLLNCYWYIITIVLLFQEKKLFGIEEDGASTSSCLDIIL